MSNRTPVRGHLWVVWLILLATLNACRPVTPTPPPTAPVPPSVEYPDGMGGRLLLPSDVAIPPPPAHIQMYQAHTAYEVQPSDLRTWAARWGLTTPWVGYRVGRGDGPRLLAVDGASAVGLDGDGVYILPLGGNDPRRAGDTWRELFQPALFPPLEGMRWHEEESSPAWARYTAWPLLDDLPVQSQVPWGLADIVQPLGLWAARVQPFIPEPHPPSRVGTAFHHLLERLGSADPPHPLARIITPHLAGPSGPLAVRVEHGDIQPGEELVLVGSAWIYRGGDTGQEVRAWVRTGAGTFELIPVPHELLALAAQGEIQVKGRLLSPGTLRPEEVAPAPPRLHLRGELLREAAGWVLRQDDGTLIHLSDIPEDMSPGAVVVEGHLVDGRFRWERIYADNASDRASTHTLHPSQVRPIVRVTPVYWLTWEDYTVNGRPTHARILPAWRLVTRVHSVEEILIYPMLQEEHVHASR